MATNRTTQSDNLRFELVSEPGSEHPPEPPLHLVHRALRGRYRLAALVAALLATVGGSVGYFAGPAKYVSTGLVHIEGALPAILYPTQESQVPPMFDEYVAGQVAYLRSGHLLAAAVDLPEMTDAGWPTGPRGVSALRDALTVRRGRREHTISVSVTHRDPRLAQIAANAVLDAYSKSDPGPGGLSLAAKEQTLVRREERLEAQLQALRQRILESSSQYGHDAIEQIHARKVDELVAIDQKREQIRLERRNLEVGLAAGRVAQLGGSTTLSPLKAQEVALLAEIKSSKYAPDHPVMRDLHRKLAAIRIQMELRQSVEANQAAGRGESDLDATMLGKLDRLEAGYAAARDRLREEAAALGRQRIVLAGLGDEVTEIKGRLATTRRRLDEIRFEAGRKNGDRIRIVNGGLPGLPASDRRAGLAGAGVLFGAAGGAALIVLIGLRDRRIRFVDELEAMKLPATVVGLRPYRAAGTDNQDFATADVRRLRHLLQLQRGGPEKNIHAVTSSERGEGKTDLALALAASFAEAGHKTLLVDGDFVSARVSRELELSDRPGVREGIGAGNGSGKIHPTRRANLWCMPIGSAHGLMPRDFTRETVCRLYDDLRHGFDAIIVDTSPVRTEFEACLIAAESDQVVMLVVLFNRATASDLRKHDEIGPGTSTPLGPCTATADEPDAHRPLRANFTGEAPEAPSPATEEWKRAA
jgi:uncharacterized protein involved in exopolysaccharide biosynthesis/Mrp family chromosome partitioning ATPase